MNKTELVDLVNNEINDVDYAMNSIATKVRQFVKENPEGINWNHIQWVLAHAEDSYVSYVHDLERLVKTLKGEPFAGKN